MELQAIVDVATGTSSREGHRYSFTSRAIHLKSQRMMIALVQVQQALVQVKPVTLAQALVKVMPLVNMLQHLIGV